jgi:ParB family chromosome partitioning protein
VESPAGSLEPLGSKSVSEKTGELPDASEGQAAPPKPLGTLPVSSLHPNPFQPRSEISKESIGSLVASIRQSGILQPIAVRPCSGGYEIIAGERRWTAAKAAGLDEVPVIIRKATDEQMVELALVENIQREDLNPIDRAKAYQQFCDRFNLRPNEVAERVGEDRSTVVNYIRLLDLSEELQGWVASGLLSAGHARTLLGISDPAERIRVAKVAIQNKPSVRELEVMVKNIKLRIEGHGPGLEREAGIAGGSGTRDVGAHIRELEDRFERALKTKVTIRPGKRKGRGKILIDYYTLDDFDRMASLLGVSVEE